MFKGAEFSADEDEEVLELDGGGTVAPQRERT